MSIADMAGLQGWAEGVRKRDQHGIAGRAWKPGLADRQGVAETEPSFSVVEHRHRQQLYGAILGCGGADKELQAEGIGSRSPAAD